MKRVFSLILILMTCVISMSQEIPKWKIDKLEQFIEHANRPTIINFWATFCKPCIEELPYFVKLAKRYEADSIQFLLVSLDLPEDYSKIKKFFIKRKISLPVVYLDETNADLFCSIVDKNWSGAIPATLFMNMNTGYRKFYDDQISEFNLEMQIKDMLNHVK